MCRTTLLGAALLATLLAGGDALAGPSSTTFDIARYAVPAGYKVEATTPTTRTLTLSKGGTLCSITLMAATPSAGSAQQDFDADWEMVRGQMAVGQAASQAAAGPPGWQLVMGGAPFTLGDFAGVVVLTTLSGGGQRFSLVLRTNRLEACEAGYAALIKSLVLPSPKAPPAATAAPVDAAPAPAAPAASAASAAGASGFRHTITNFDDGWTATERPDWVEVTSGVLTLRLHYPIPLTDELRRIGPEARVRVFWDQLVGPRFRAARLDVAPTELGVGSMSFGQADAVDLQTGRPAHVATLVYSDNGAANVIEVVAPDAATFQRRFPNYDAIRAMTAANKFEVAPSDLAGTTWENSSAAYGMYYATATGAFAGMRGGSTYDRFRFPSPGRYARDFLGVATGSGPGTVSQGTLTGRFDLHGWDATATTSTGQVTQYWVQFRAIRGGRLLILEDKNARALHYELAKLK